MARVPAFQAGCCEFESRLPLHKKRWKCSTFFMFFFVILLSWEVYLKGILCLTQEKNAKEKYY